MPFSYRSGWLIALALFLLFAGLAQPRVHQDGSKRSNFARYLLVCIGLALVSFAIYGCATADTLV